MKAAAFRPACSAHLLPQKTGEEEAGALIMNFSPPHLGRGRDGDQPCCCPAPAPDVGGGGGAVLRGDDRIDPSMKGGEGGRWLLTRRGLAATDLTVAGLIDLTAVGLRYIIVACPLSDSSWTNRSNNNWINRSNSSWINRLKSS